MSGFFDLVGFEYKKMLSRKSALISLAVTLLVVALSPFEPMVGRTYINGEPGETHYEAIVKDRAYARALSGRVMDEALFNEMLDAYMKIPEDAQPYAAAPEYEQYARPYSAVYNFVLRALRDTGSGSLEDMRRLLPDVYALRAERAIKNINELRIGERSKEALIEKVNTWETPITFEYTDGYNEHFAGMSISAVLIALTVAICLAPMFAGEYSAGTSQLILSSRHGKGRLIGAKLFTAMTFTVMLALVLSLLSVTLYGLVFGFDGLFSPAQLIPLYNGMWFDFSILQMLCFFTLCTLLGTAMTAAFTLLLSARFKSPFGVIILVGAVLLTPLLYRISPNVVWAYNLYQLLPANLMYYDAVTGYPYEIFGLPVMPYVFMPLFALIASAVMLPFAWRGFRMHQEG